MKKSLIAILFLISLGAFYVFINSISPADTEYKGEPADIWIQVLSLLTALISLIGAIITLKTSIAQKKDMQKE